MRNVHLTLLLCAALGCGSDDDDPVNAAGMYTLALRTTSNGCMIQGFQVGDTGMGVPFTVTQDPASPVMVSGRVGGIPGGILGLWFGTEPVFRGTVRGDKLEMLLEGRNVNRQGTCVATTAAAVTATLRGDVLQGQVRYHYKTNDTPACEAMERCETIQTFNGTRPPTTAAPR